MDDSHAATGDILREAGTLFPNRLSAGVARTRQGMKATHDIVPTDGGFALRPKAGNASVSLQKRGKQLTRRPSRPLTAAEFADQYRRRLLNAIIKIGGIEQREMPDITGEGRIDRRTGRLHAKIGGLARRLFIRNGHSPDVVIQTMQELGYFPDMRETCPHPTQPSAHFPAGFVQCDAGANASPLHQGSRGPVRTSLPVVPEPGTDAPPHLQPPAQLQHRRRLAIGQTQMLVQHGGQRLHPQSQPRGSTACRLPSLARVPTLHRLPTMPATAQMNPKLDALHPRLGNLGLVLRHHARFLDPAAAMRAARRQRHLNAFVDARVNRAAGTASVVGSRLASRRGGMGLGMAARKRRRLPACSASSNSRRSRSFFACSSGTLRSKRAIFSASVSGSTSQNRAPHSGK